MSDSLDPKLQSIELKNKRVTIMGLGLHGGGLASARYCAERGAHVTVTDLRSADTLKSSVEKLSDLPGIELVLGEHREQDFAGADIVVKNPAVPRTAKYLNIAIEHGAEIHTDLSLFFAEVMRLPDVRIIAVTGSKGKSSTASIIHHCLSHCSRNSYLGGNITISPLTHLQELSRNNGSNSFADGTPAKNPLYFVLELSSFQIGDLRYVYKLKNGMQKVIDYAVVTNIFRDHQDYYPDMQSYVSDKVALLDLCRPGAKVVLGQTGDWQDQFERSALAGGLNQLEPAADELVPLQLLVPGAHQRSNMRMAFAIVNGEVSDRQQIIEAMKTFPGVPHRLQYIGSIAGNRVYNDSAATIPEASLAAVRAFDEDVYLICGGSDKDLDLSPLETAIRESSGACLLKGSASDRLIDNQLNTLGTFDNLDDAIASLTTAMSASKSKSVLLLSPGCASFGLFLNEFDRGRRFVSAVNKLQQFSPAL